MFTKQVLRDIENINGITIFIGGDLPSGKVIFMHKKDGYLTKGDLDENTVRLEDDLPDLRKILRSYGIPTE